jgi:hypothetical protein
MKAAAAKLLGADPVKLAIGVAIVGGVGYLLLRQVAKDIGKVGGAAASAAGGLVTGNNAATQGTVYEGAGVAGTLGGAANAAIPILDDIGSWLGGKIYEWTHPSWNEPAPTAPVNDDQDERDWWPFW